MSGLLQRGRFRFNSGLISPFKIECDALNEEDWATAAMLVVARVDPFGKVEGVPSGGVKLASALQQYVSAGPLLIVDDVLTTGGSMERHRDRRDAIGAVLFSHGTLLDWVTPIFVLSQTEHTMRSYRYPDGEE